MSTFVSRHLLAKTCAAAIFLGVIVAAEPGSAPLTVPQRAARPAPTASVNFGSAAAAGKRGPVAPPAMTFTVPPAPAVALAAPVTATLRDTVTGDVNGDGHAAPGDTLTYTATIAATGADATGVTFSAALDPNTTLVPGSLAASGVTVDDSYFTTQNTALTRPAATGVLANDFAGLPASAVTAFQTPTPHAGTVTVAADGSFTYTPAAGYVGADTFTYTITNASGSSTATVHLDVFVAALAADDTYGVTRDAALAVPAPGVLANDTGTPAPTLTASAGATAQGGTVTLNADGSFVYTPPSGFVSPPADTFSYSIANIAGTSTGTVHLVVDAPPAVVGRAPAAGATNVAGNANISLTFSEPVTVTATAFALACPSGTPVPFTNTTGLGPATTFVLDPTPILPAGTTCTVTTIGAEISDTDANDPPDHGLANDVFTFTTDAAPIVTTTVPANTALNIALTANLAITFSEPVNVTGNWFQIVCSVSGTRNPAATAVTGGPTTFTIDPTADFAPGDVCTTTVFAAQVSDQDPNDPPDTPAANYAFTFTTDLSPAVSTTTPLNGATSITTNANLTITFSEPVDVTGNWFQIVCSVSGTRNVSDTALTGGPTFFTIDPTTDFTPAETCTTTVFAAQVSDQDPNDPPDAMTANFVFSFTLEAAPGVITTVPANGATGITTNGNLTITFSEPVAVTGNWFQIVCATSGTRNVADTVVTGGPSAFTVDPALDFAAGESCTVSVFAAQVTDQDSNDPPDNMLANFVFSFTTDAAPGVAATLPVNAAVNQASNADLTITFSEPVTLTGEWFQIVCSASGTRHVGDTVVTGGPTTFVVNPNSDFSSADSCTTTVFAAQVSDTDTNDPADTPLADFAFTFTIDAAPSVASTLPANGATGVALNADLTVTFSEPVNVTGNWFQIVCSVSGTRTVGDTLVSGGPTTFTINPITDFAAADNCTLTVAGALVTDQDANDPPDTMTADHVVSFLMDAAPGVTTTVPVNGAVSIATNANLTITFSEPVDVTGNWFQIVCASSGTRNVADTAVSGGPGTFTVNPTTDFTAGETCTTTVFAAQVNDQDANDPPDAMAANLVFSFTLEAAPSVTTTAPVNGAPTATTTQDLTITFSEPVDVAGNWFQIVCGTSGTRNVADTIVTGGPTTFTVNPNADFAAGESCTTTVFAAQITDQDAIDPPDNMLANYVFSFTTDVAPSVTTTTPVNGATDQASSIDLTITFSEPVNVTGNWFQIVCTSSGTRNVSDTVVSGGPTTFTINPNANFTSADSCTTTVFAAQVSDQDAADPPDTLAADHVFSFTIDAAPGVTTTGPANGASGVVLSTDLTVTFSEPVTVTGETWYGIACTLSGVHAGVTTGGPTTFTINPAANFAAGESCTGQVIFNQVSDQDGNDPPDQMVSTYTWTFSTDAAPAVSTTTPANGAVSILSNANVDVTFSEPVNAAGASFTLSCTVSGAHTFALSGSPVTFTLNPDTDFTPGETCTTTVLAAGVTDVDLNDPPDNMLANYVFSFTIEAAPFVQSSTPADTGVQGTNQDVSITFSEPVNVTGNWFAIACPSGTQNVADTNVTTSDNTTFTINPNTDFLVGEGPCTLTVFAAQVNDQDANDPPDFMVANAVINFTIDVPPGVFTTDPANASTNAGPTQNITIMFTEPVDVSGSWFSIVCTTSGTHTATVSGGPTTFTLDPNADFVAPETCTVTVVAAQVADQDTGDPPDLMAANYVFSFGTDAAPSVTVTTPTNAAVDQAGSTNLTITFSEAVNVNAASWFQIACPTSGTRTPANTAVTAGPATTFTINPNVDFASAETCTATVFAAQVTDVDSNDPPDTMAADYVFSFTIDAAPQVTTTVPANGAANLAGNTTITINFTEPVNVAAGGVTIGCPAGVGFTPALPQNGVTSLVLTPTTTLPGAASCTVTVVAANVHDVDTNDPPDLLDGNGDGTPGDNYVFSFTVDAAPRVAQPTSPANGATNQATNGNITINFTEPVDLATGAVTLACPAGVPFTSTPALPATGATSLVLDPTSDLPAGATCTVTVLAANVTDTDAADPPDQLDGNGDGVSGDNHVFSFTTDAAPRVTIPTSPANGATNVPPSSNITINFSELVNIAAGGITIACPVGTPISFTPALPATGVSSIVLDPTTSLPGDATCTVTVLALGVTDADANDPPDQLDGNGDNVPGDDHVLTFTVAPEAANDSYPVSPHLTLSIPAGTGVKANDNPTSVTITGFGSSLATANGALPNGTNTVTTTLGTGGVVTLNADGSFTYIPPPDIVNATDHFFYTVTGGDTADVSLVIQNQTPLIWFVDASYAGANGTSNGTQGRPFTLLTGAGSFDASALPDNNTNDVVFIKQGGYTCGLSLVNTQRIIGDGSSSDLATIVGYSPATGSAFPAFTGTDPTLTSAATCLTLGLNNTIRGVTLDPSAAAATAISGATFGTLTMSESTINGLGRAFNLTTSGTLNVTLDRLVSTGSSTNGITLSAVGGTVTVNNVGGTSNIQGATAADASVSGGAVSITYNGNVTQANNAALLSVAGGHTGTLTFQNGTLSATSGTGLQFDDADGTYSFNGTTTLNGGDAGIDILNGSSGTFGFGTGATITDTSGTAFNLSSSNATVTYGGSISDNSGFAVDIDNHDSGTVTFQTGTLTSTGAGLRVANSNGGTINFNSISTSLSTTSNTAVTLDTNNGGGIINFNHGATGNGLDLVTTTGIGFSALGGGTITVQGAGNTINSGNKALDFASIVVGGSGVTFDSVTSSGGANAVKLVSVTGGAIALGSGSLSATAAGLLVGDGVGTANTGGTAAISYSGTITTTGTARTVNIQDRQAGAGNITLSGTLSHTGGNASGVFLDDNAGGIITFSGANSVLNSGTVPGVSLTDNTGATINFTGGGLDIDTTSGIGFNATGGGTVNVTGSANTINSTTGTAINIANTTIGASNVTFRSVSSGGSGNGGIILNTTGSSGGLKVTGLDGGDADVFADAGSGGTIANKTGGDLHTISGSLAVPNGTTAGVGLYLKSTQHASFEGMQLNDFSNFALFAVDSTDVTIKDSVVSGSNGDNAGIDEGAVSFYNQTGTANITRSSISGGSENNLMVLNTTGTLNRFTVSSSTFGFNNTTTGNNSILVESQNSGTTLNFTLEGSLIKGSRADWINASNNSTSTMDLVIGGATGGLGNTFDNLGANLHPGAAAGGNRVVLGSVGTMTFDINNNTLKGSKGEAIRVRSTATGAVTGTATGYVRNNTIGVQGTANSGSSEGSGIFLFGDGGSDMTAVVSGNQVFQYNNHGIRMLFGDEINNGSLFAATVIGNTVNTPGNINSDFNAILLTNGSVSATDDFTTCLDVGSANPALKNNVTNGGSGSIFPNNAHIRLNQRFNTTIQLPGYTGPAKDAGDGEVAEVETYLAARNTLTTSAANNSAGAVGGFVNTPGGAACATPPFLLLVEGVEGSGDNPAVAGQIAGATAAAVIAAAHDRLNAPARVEGRTAFMDLPPAQLGSGTQLALTFDRSAAGWGWFVDPTPDRDEEFGPPSPKTGERVAVADGPAAGKIDLLTALMHEIAHARGERDLDPVAHAGELMAATLPIGVRRGPLPLLASRSIGNIAAPMPVAVSGETVMVNVGTLPAGKSIVITYRATINPNPITGPGFSLTHQGTVTGTNFTTIVTDDPDTAAADDATITAMVCPTITIAPASLAPALLGTPYRPVTFTATGGNGTTTFARTGTLPTGLTFDASTATLSGTPTAAGAFTFTITASDQNGCEGTQSYTLLVAGGRTILTGADAGGGPHVRRFGASDGSAPTRGALDSFFAFDPTFTGGVRVAEGDVNGDGEPDYIAGAGPGGDTRINVFDGATGAVLYSILAFEPESRGGVYVAAGDVDGDGFADIVAGSGAGRSGQVRVFSGRDGTVLRDQFVFERAFVGGVRVAAGDVNGDGRADLVVGSGFGRPAEVRVLNADDGATLRAFMPYGPFFGGVFVAAGDVTGDGFADIVTGAGAGGGPHVMVVNGLTGVATLSFFAFDADFAGGVRVAAGDVNGDGRADVIVGSGPGRTATVRVFDAATAALLNETAPYGPYPAGVFVATRVAVNRMAVNPPLQDAVLSGPFTVAGWALVDNDASAGIAAIHVWAVPVGGGAPLFVGLATLGDVRPDVAAFYGAQYDHAGFHLDASALPPGAYYLAAFAQGSVTGTFRIIRVVRVTVIP